MITTSRKRIIVGTIALLVILGTGFAVKKVFFSKAKASFITADVVKRDLEESVLASGILKAFKTVAVGAQVSGQLKTLHVALGDKVKKGQLLAIIDKNSYRLQVQQAEAMYEQVKASTVGGDYQIAEAKTGITQAKTGITQAKSAVEQAESAHMLAALKLRSKFES